MNYDHWRNYARGWVFHFIGKPDIAYAAYAEAFRIDPADSRPARHLAAISADRKRWEMAESWFEKVLALQPEDADTWFNLGFVREHAGKAEAAIAAFGEAVRLKPAQDRAWYGKGLAHARLGQHDAAADALRRLAMAHPGVGFRLDSDERTLIDLPRAAPSLLDKSDAMRLARLGAIMGRAFLCHRRSRCLHWS